MEGCQTDGGLGFRGHGEGLGSEGLEQGQISESGCGGEIFPQ